METSTMSKHGGVQDIKHHANLGLQILLYFNIYIAIAWAILYGYYLWRNFTELTRFQSVLILIGYLLCLLIEYGRLYAGYSGNLRAKSGDLNIFITVSLLIQLPTLFFLLLSTKTSHLYINISTITVLALIAIEIGFSVYAAVKLSRHESTLCKLKCERYLRAHASGVKRAT